MSIKMLTTLFWLWFVSSVVFALPSNLTFPTRGCGTDTDPAAIIKAEQHFRTALSKAAFRDDISAAVIPPIPVVWHVIQRNSNLAGGNIPDSAIQANILATNQHYAGTGISFQLYKITRTTNSAWFSSVEPGTQLQGNMKGLLHEGNSATLNVYTVGFEASTILGYSTIPSDYQGNPIDDGVVIAYSSLPGGSRRNYNEGKTLTHEIGHWLGLLHPFQGGCIGDGDFVSDTPPQAVQTDGCPTRKDTCPGSGADSIHNYMDYSFDSCLNTFTPGQVSRLTQYFLTYRQMAT